MRCVECELGGGQLGRRAFGGDPEPLAVGREIDLALLVGAVDDGVVETL